MSVRVYCHGCSTWYDDAASCDCARPRLRAVETRVPPPRRLSHFGKVLITALALEPRSEEELGAALRAADASLREVN
jgi:hypothetical protein